MFLSVPHLFLFVPFLFYLLFLFLKNHTTSPDEGRLSEGSTSQAPEAGSPPGLGHIMGQMNKVTSKMEIIVCFCLKTKYQDGNNRQFPNSINYLQKTSNVGQTHPNHKPCPVLTHKSVDTQIHGEELLKSIVNKHQAMNNICFPAALSFYLLRTLCTAFLYQPFWSLSLCHLASHSLTKSLCLSLAD